MPNEDRRVWTVFNGEIFNYQSVRADLMQRGHNLRGTSDTEILPHLWEELHQEMAAVPRGQFAFAVWDADRQQLFLCRDRFGIKPLFYARTEHTLAFASEINALRAVPGIDWTPDPQAIADYTALLYIPGPSTLYRGVKSLLPGHTLTASLQNDEIVVDVKPYHKWGTHPRTCLTMQQAEEQAMHLLDTAVASQLRSDVPLGSLLSGGIDSSLVSEAAQRALQGRLNTYNVQFSDRDYDETWAAQSVARHINSHHEVLPMEPMEGSWGRVCSLLQAAGQPFADTSVFAVNGVCRHMRQHVTVALSGDGGDEGFGGYNTYWQVARIHRWQSLPSVVRWLIRKSGAMGKVLKPEIGRILDRMADFEHADETTVIQNLFCWLRADEHRALMPSLGALLPVRRHFEPVWQNTFEHPVSRLERLSAHLTEIDVRMSLANDFLFKVDIASMQESLEVRVPMLDEDLFAFGLTLPHNLKVEGRTGKQVLRSIAFRRLPKEVAEKSKRGFGVPVDVWVDENFKGELKSVLTRRSSPLWDILSRDFGTKLIRAFCDGEPLPRVSRQGLYQRAVMLLSLHLHLGGAR
jgi:asparagine synthase (glutamine-hydrolysing)